MSRSMQKTSYDKMPDEDLVRLARENTGGTAENYLLEKYKDLVRQKARSMHILGGDTEDLIQEGMIGLFQAIRDYDSGRDASFRTFATLCVTRQLYTALQASGRQKNIPLNTAVSIYAEIRGGEGGDETGRSLSDTLTDAGAMDPEQRLIERENVLQLLDRIESELSPFEKQVLDLYLTGMNYTEIAHVLNRGEKSTDNALQRIRAKLKPNT